MNPTWHRAAVIVGMTAALGALACSEHAGITDSLAFAKGEPGPPNGGEEAGNNLSYPVIWSEGVTKVLPGAFGVVSVNGAYWYSWGTAGSDPNVVPMSCPPDPDDEAFCNDFVAGTVGPAPGYTTGFPDPQTLQPLVKAFLQKDADNSWQADSGTPFAMGLVAADGDPLYVDEIDWGDNLESVDWYTRSQVRTEVVLFQQNPDVANPWLEYAMRHVEGWGINEVHGLAFDHLGGTGEVIGPGDYATVFSPCARFTIQKLLVPREDPVLAGLSWVPGEGWIGTDPDGNPLVNEPLLNAAVYEAGDGPGYYNAEINVKGRIIYGYTWNVRRLNEGAGDYRATFSFDATCGTTGPALNTFFIDGVTTIRQPAEEVAAAEEEPGGGGVAVLDYGNNLTYMDIRILERGGGGGGGGGGGHGPPR